MINSDDMSHVPSLCQALSDENSQAMVSQTNCLLVVRNSSVKNKNYIKYYKWSDTNKACLKHSAEQWVNVRISQDWEIREVGAMKVSYS